MKCPDDMIDPCPGTGDEECRDCIYLRAKVDDGLKARITRALGTGPHAAWRSPKELSVILHGIRCTQTQTKNISNVLERMARRGEAESAQKFSNVTKKVTTKYKLKGTHPR